MVFSLQNSSSDLIIQCMKKDDSAAVEVVRTLLESGASLKVKTEVGLNHVNQKLCDIQLWLRLLGGWFTPATLGCTVKVISNVITPYTLLLKYGYD